MYGFCDTWYVIDSIAVNAAQDEVPDPWEHEYDETGSEAVVGARTVVVGLVLGDDVGLGVGADVGLGVGADVELFVGCVVTDVIQHTSPA